MIFSHHKECFQPDYTNILKVLYNQRPDYLPLYEHNIDAPFISKYTGETLEIVSNHPYGRRLGV